MASAGRVKMDIQAAVISNSERLNSFLPSLLAKIQISLPKKIPASLLAKSERKFPKKFPPESTRPLARLLRQQLRAIKFIPADGVLIYPQKRAGSQ